DATEKIREIGEASSDPLIQMAGKRIMTLTCHYTGEQAKGWAHHQEVMAFPDATFHQFGKIGLRLDQRLSCVTMSARLLWLRRFPDQAMSAALKGMDYANHINRPANTAYFLAFAVCPLAMWCGDLEKAGEFSAMLKDVATRHSLAVWRSVAEVYERA